MTEKRSENTRNLDFSDKYIRWFSEIEHKDIKTVGGKGASLGEMYNNKFPVPPGFVITAQAFEFFTSDIKDQINNIVVGIDFENTQELQEKTKQIRELIIKQDMTEELKQEILEDYHILSGEEINEKGISIDALNILKNSQEPIFVSVRSSATTEDLADASFAGQQQSFLNIKGDYELIEHVKKCFASLYTARAVYYRNKKGFSEEEALLAVVVQKMVDSEKSGVVFSKNPMNLKEDIILEAVFGLGEGIVSGKILPDHYIISGDAKNFKIEDIKVANKKIAIVRSSSGDNKIVKLTPEKSNEQVLSKGMILEIADYALKLESHYDKPQDIEFAVENEKVYIVQSRPITTKGKMIEGELSGTVLLQGLGASPGIGVGKVRLIKSMEDLSKIQKGDVLVTEMTDPDMVVSMQKSVAIITDEGGMTSHAAIVSREMGIPAIVGTGDATSKLENRTQVTVDGSSGKVYEGQVAETRMAEVKPAVQPDKIKLKVIVDLPEYSERAAESEIDSIGLTRVEGMIASMGKHPLQYEKENNLEEYTKILEEGISKILKPFKSMWIRSSDLRSDEYSSLKGAPGEEINPMMGLHGIRFALKHPKILEAELEAIKRVADKNPDKKVGVMFPLVISVEELKKAKEIYNKFKSQNMQEGVMIETPAAVQIIEDICKEGVDFVSFGTNDLTQFTLAVDRNEDLVQDLYDELHPAVLSQIGFVIDVCKKYNTETSICGQAGSKKQMVEFLLKKGIDSISVNADAAADISLFIKENEGNRMETKSYPDKSPLLEKHPSLDSQPKPEHKEFDKRKAEGMISKEDLNKNNIMKSDEQGIYRKEAEIIEEQPKQEQPQQDSKETQVSLTSQPSLDKERKDKKRYGVCSNCNKNFRMRFRPKEGRPILCRACFKQGQRDEKNQEKVQLPETSKNIEPVKHEEVEQMKEDVEKVQEENKELTQPRKGTQVPLTSQPSLEMTEHVGPVHSIDETGRIEEKIQEIKQEVEKEKLEDLQEKQEIEESIKTETTTKPINEQEKEESEEVEESDNEKVEETKEEEVEEPVAGSDMEDVGVYNPNSEEDNNSPQAAQYKFDEEDEDVFSDVF